MAQEQKIDHELIDFIMSSYQNTAKNSGEVHVGLLTQVNEYYQTYLQKDPYNPELLVGRFYVQFDLMIESWLHWNQLTDQTQKRLALEVFKQDATVLQVLYRDCMSADIKQRIDDSGEMFCLVFILDQIGNGGGRDQIDQYRNIWKEFRASLAPEGRFRFGFIYATALFDEANKTNDRQQKMKMLTEAVNIYEGLLDPSYQATFLQIAATKRVLAEVLESVNLHSNADERKEEVRSYSQGGPSLNSTSSQSYQESAEAYISAILDLSLTPLQRNAAILGLRHVLPKMQDDKNRDGTLMVAREIVNGAELTTPCSISEKSSSVLQQLVAAGVTDSRFPMCQRVIQSIRGVQDNPMRVNLPEPELPGQSPIEDVLPPPVISKGIKEKVIVENVVKQSAAEGVETHKRNTQVAGAEARVGEASVFKDGLAAMLAKGPLAKGSVSGANDSRKQVVAADIGMGSHANASEEPKPLTHLTANRTGLSGRKKKKPKNRAGFNAAAKQPELNEEKGSGSGMTLERSPPVVKTPRKPFAVIGAGSPVSLVVDKPAPKAEPKAVAEPAKKTPVGNSGTVAGVGNKQNNSSVNTPKVGSPGDWRTELAARKKAAAVDEAASNDGGRRGVKAEPAFSGKAQQQGMSRASNAPLPAGIGAAAGRLGINLVLRRAIPALPAAGAANAVPANETAMQKFKRLDKEQADAKAAQAVARGAGRGVNGMVVKQSSE